jgi:collagenase-like PrtC family protease
MEFRGAFTDIPLYVEQNNGHDETEKGVNFSVKQQVEGFSQAARTLDVYRSGNYDLDEGDPDDFSVEDPTRRPGIDMVEVDNIHKRLQERALERRKAVQKRRYDKVKADEKERTEKAVKEALEAKARETPKPAESV